MPTNDNIPKAAGPMLLAALRAGAADPHRRGAVEILAGYNTGELLDDDGIRAYIVADGDGAGTAYVKWNNLGDALGAVNCPIDLSETAEAAVFLACAVAAGTPARRLHYGVKQWDDDNARAITRGFAIACGLPDPYDIIARTAELADAAIATGSAVGVAVGAVLANVIRHGTRITSPDQLREALGVAITDPDERSALRTRPDLRDRLAGATMPWQSPTLTAAERDAAGSDYATRWARALNDLRASDVDGEVRYGRFLELIAGAGAAGITMQRLWTALVADDMAPPNRKILYVWRDGAMAAGLIIQPGPGRDALIYPTTVYPASAPALDGADPITAADYAASFPERGDDGEPLEDEAAAIQAGAGGPGPNLADVVYAAGQPAPRVDTQGPDVLDAAVYDIVAASPGPASLPGVLAGLREQTGSPTSIVVVTSSLERLVRAGRIVSSKTDTTTLYRLTPPAAPDDDVEAAESTETGE